MDYKVIVVSSAMKSPDETKKNENLWVERSARNYIMAVPFLKLYPNLWTNANSEDWGVRFSGTNTFGKKLVKYHYYRASQSHLYLVVIVMYHEEKK